MTSLMLPPSLTKSKEEQLKHRRLSGKKLHLPITYMGTKAHQVVKVPKIAMRMPAQVAGRSGFRSLCQIIMLMTKKRSRSNKSGVRYLMQRRQQLLERCRTWELLE